LKPEEKIRRYKMRNLLLTLTVVMALCLTANMALATPADDTATASVTVTVDGIMEWSGNFSTIALSPITTQAGAPTASQSTTLYTNGDVHISANITTAAQLKLGTDPNQTLVTSYKLTDDGDGTATTGGTDQTVYTGYATFLNSAYVITHKAGDGADMITLWAKAENPSGEVADAGDYSATQTLTASWGNP
jgi:hypothetical protein